MGFVAWLGANGLAIACIVQGVLVLSVLLCERKRPENALAWAFLATLLPGLGFLAYLFLWHLTGMRRVRGRERLSVDDDIQEALRDAARAVQREADCPWQVARLVRRQNDSPCTGDNALEILVDAHEKYPRLFGDIRDARSSVHLSYFIFEKDATGTEMRDLLAQKAGEGVEVRLHVDRLGSFFAPKSFFHPIVAAGGSVRRYLPTIGMTLRRINNHCHRKSVVIDGRIGYTGGINIGDEYLGSKTKTAPWRDTQIRVCGPAVAGMQQRFFLDWALCGGDVPQSLERYFPEAHSGGAALAQVVCSGPERPGEEVKFAYMKLATEARRSLYVQTPYFAPDEPFLQSLYLAAATGVDVRVMIPGKPDKKYAYWVTLSHVEDLLRRGIRVFSYPGFLHAKMLVADDEVVSIGTANIDVRSFALDYEHCVLGYDAAFGARCARVFEADQARCAEMTLEAFGRRSGWEKAMEAVWRVLRALM